MFIYISENKESAEAGRELRDSYLTGERNVSIIVIRGYSIFLKKKKYTFSGVSDIITSSQLEIAA